MHAFWRRFPARGVGESSTLSLVKKLSEAGLIEHIRQAVGAGARRGGVRLVRGIGDDCAQLAIPADHELLVTTDFTLENIHFRRAWHPAESVGWRALARGVSDIASMGGRPVAAFLSLALPADIDVKWAEKFFDGMLKLAKEHGVVLAGGDTSQSPAGVLADITVIGVAPDGEAIPRSGAQPHDRIYVTGELGAPISMLERMYAEPDKSYKPKQCPQHFWPQPQVAVGERLRKNKIASAMIDISDGLSTEIRHICRESGVGAVLQSNAIPLALFDGHEVDLRCALHGGDEYQLLFTAPQSKRVPRSICGVPITMIGHVSEETDVMLEDAEGRVIELPEGGWQHFRPKKK